jgi:prephenate dehydrogenase
MQSDIVPGEVEAPRPSEMDERRCDRGLSKDSLPRAHWSHRTTAMIERIAILGTGLLGTSAGLALRAAGFKGAITGWNRSPEQARTALKMGAIDSIAADAIETARESHVVLLAVPVFAIIDFMEQLAPALGPDRLVTDVGSTKGQIAAAAARLYNQPGRAAFLPGHPMAGKEQGGAALADAALFRGAVWIFTDDPEAQRSAFSAGLATAWRGWVAALGAKIVDLDAARHDELVAWVSHLPQFVSTALSALLEDRVGEAPELKDVGGRALREMTRLGASPFSMWRDIAHTNTANIEAVLHALEQRLAHLRENLRTPALRDEFEQANRFRRE